VSEPKDEMRLAILREYDPGKLLDAVCEKLNLENDASLGRALGIAPHVINKIRLRKTEVEPALLVRMHEETDFTIRQLRVLMGERRMRPRVHG